MVVVPGNVRITDKLLRAPVHGPLYTNDAMAPKSPGIIGQCKNTFGNDNEQKYY